MADMKALVEQDGNYMVDDIAGIVLFVYIEVLRTS